MGLIWQTYLQTSYAFKHLRERQYRAVNNFVAKHCFQRVLSQTYATYRLWVDGQLVLHGDNFPQWLPLPWMHNLVRGPGLCLGAQFGGRQPLKLNMGRQTQTTDQKRKPKQQHNKFDAVDFDISATCIFLFLGYVKGAISKIPIKTSPSFSHLYFFQIQRNIGMGQGSDSQTRQKFRYLPRTCLNMCLSRFLIVSIGRNRYISYL